MTTPTGQAGPLWSKVRIRDWLTDNFRGGVGEAEELAETILDDLSQALAAKDERIAHLEANADPEALTIAYGKGYADAQSNARARIASLESQLSISQQEHDKQAQLLYDKNQRIAELVAYAKNYTGLEATPCPFCEVEDGVLLKECGFHKVMFQTERVAELEEQLKQCHSTYRELSEAVAGRSEYEVVPDGKYCNESPDGSEDWCLKVTDNGDSIWQYSSSNDEWGYQWGSDIQQQIYDRIDAALAFVREQQAQQYSHRNGETEPPTMEGWYSIQHRQAWNWDGSAFVFVEVDMDGTSVYFVGQDDAIPAYNLDDAIRWYGPITPPWETQRPQPTDAKDGGDK